MNLRAKVVLTNAAMIMALLFSLRWYSLIAVAITAAYLLPLANLAVFLKAKRDGKKNHMAGGL